MTGEKTDRRVRRTNNLLLQGLLQLMKEKDIKDISVKELTDLVDINRGTFYLHYSDIYDFLFTIENQVFAEFNDILDKTLSEKAQPAPLGETLLNIFHFLDNHRELGVVMLGPHGDLSFVNRLKALVKDHIEHLLVPNQSSQSFDFYYAFVVNGFIGVITEWLNSPVHRTPEEMAKFCSGLIDIPGLHPVL